MSLQKIRLFIGLLSVALIGLIGVQYYWIQQVNAVNKERFTKTVNDVLQSVTQQLARNNDFNFISNDINQIVPIPSNDFNTLTDSSQNMRSPLSQMRGPSNMLEVFNSSFEAHLDERTGELVINFMLQGGNPYRNKESDFQAQNLAMEKQMNQRLNLLKKNFFEHMLGSGALFERVNPITLDTLLSNALREHNIDLDYAFGIVDRQKNKLKLLNPSNEENQKAVLNSSLSTNLFPTDLKKKEYYLSLNFPEQDDYLLKQAILPLSASGLLMLIVIACFTYAINIILKQKKISEIKTDFINNMTHEFKTPISTVSLATQALSDEELKNRPGLIDRYVKVIQDENNRLGLQVEKVLQIASLDKKDFKLKIESTDVHDIIEKALVNVKIMVDNKGGQISSQLLATESMVEADKVHLTNIIYNLLDNANKYSTDAPQIHIRTENISSGVIIKVSDQGIGMNKEATQKIFEKFYRVTTGNVHDVKGFGLGLSYVKNIVEMHHGQIQVKSEPGKGSTFKIILPFKHGKL